MNPILFAITCTDNAPGGEVVNTTCLPHSAATPDAIKLILSIVFGVTASIAFLVVVISGFRYTVAHGDPNAVSQAKKSLLYAIVGLLVSLSAFSIVTFVIRSTT